MNSSLCSSSLSVWPPLVFLPRGAVVNTRAFNSGLLEPDRLLLMFPERIGLVWKSIMLLPSWAFPSDGSTGLETFCFWNSQLSMPTTISRVSMGPLAGMRGYSTYPQPNITGHQGPSHFLTSYKATYGQIFHLSSLSSDPYAASLTVALDKCLQTTYCQGKEVRA